MNLYIFNKSSQGALFGIGTYISELTAALQNSDINTCVVNLRSDKPQIQKEEINGIRYWYFPVPIPEQRANDNKNQVELYYRNVVYLLQLPINDRKNLLFHLNYLDSKLLTDLLKSVFDCKIVFVVHYLDSVMTLLGNISRFRRIISQTDELTNTEEISAKMSFYKEKELLQSQSIDKIICLSHHTFEILHQDYKIDKEKMVVIYNGIEDVRQIPATNKEVLRKKWHISDKEFLILFVGRLQPVKGLAFLIKAFRVVLEKLPDCRLMVAGNGNYDTYLQEVKDICTKITFIGILEKKELDELYQIADIGVMPSFHEQCSCVAIEMMMHGLPIIGSTSTGLCEIVENHVTGLHIPVIEYDDNVDIDTELIAEKMLYLLRHPEERKRMGANASKRYDRLYSSKVARVGMLSFYDSI